MAIEEDKEVKSPLNTDQKGGQENGSENLDSSSSQEETKIKSENDPEDSGKVEEAKEDNANDSADLEGKAVEVIKEENVEESVEVTSVLTEAEEATEDDEEDEVFYTKFTISKSHFFYKIHNFQI